MTTALARTTGSHGETYRSANETMELISSVCTQMAQRKLGVDDAISALTVRHNITAHRPTVRRLLFAEWRRIWGRT